MVNFKTYGGYEYIDIPELTKLRAKFSKKNCNDFFKWYNNYVISIIKTKTYSNTFICNAIFRNNINSDKQMRDYIFANLYISNEYVKYIQTTISDKKNIKKYKSIIELLRIDLERIIVKTELDYKKSKQRLQLMSGNRKSLSPIEMLWNTKSLFYIEEHKKVEDIYSRDLRPLAIFQIRQLLEVYAKKLLGYYSIVDDNGMPIKKFSQIAWDFIKKEVGGNNSKIKLPFDINVITKINKWTNTFVHTGYFCSNYVIHFVLECIVDLFKQPTSSIQTYDGKCTLNLDYGAVEIRDYNTLKQSFETYLKSNSPNTNVNVKWLELKYVGAYIVSL